MPDAVPFEAIETQKENIEPLRAGRAASALAKSFAENPVAARGEHAEERQKFEQRIAESAEDDDPLEAYVDYIKWLNDTYPQGHSTESNLIPLLERCTSQFRDTACYKNDPRYMRVWMQYIKYSDAPREVFTYLARKEIGKNLATFYEEYAGFLESQGRQVQADEVYQLGIQARAHPLSRLERRYGEFQARMAANPPSVDQPSSPAMPVVRQALALKGTSGAALDDDEAAASSAPQPSKIQVFADPEGRQGKVANPGGWDSIGDLATRRKENRIEARPWAGEKLDSQETVRPKKTLEVYRDKPQPVTTASNGKRENMAVAVEFLQDDNGEELCLEELLVRLRGPFDKKAMGFDEPTGPIAIGDEEIRPPSPTATMTFFTKAATSDVYEMFNQKINDASDEEEESRSGYSGYTSNEDEGDDNENDNEDAARYVDDGAVGDSDSRANHQSIDVEIVDRLAAIPEHEEEEEDQAEMGRQRLKQAMTPIAEMSEPEMTDAPAMSDSRVREAVPVPTPREPESRPPAMEGVVNPTDVRVRTALLPAMESTLTQSAFWKIPGTTNQLSQLEKELQGRRGSAQAALDLPGPNERVLVRGVLGRGGYGSVFAAETAQGQRVAIKLEKTSVPWEFYVLRAAHNRLQGHRDALSVIGAKALVSHDNEQWMLLDLQDQGTLLDVVNLMHAHDAVDEKVVVFFVIELMRAVEALHAAHIVHGDIKPENVMVRVDRNDPGAWSKYYREDGDDGWAQRGVCLIDFGRAIDTTLFPASTQFIADWKADELDCPAMHEGRPWTYEPDYFGLASVAHLLLFGTYLKPARSPGGNYRISQSLKRYWQRDLWNEFFDTLLNPANHGPLPISTALQECRQKFEVWLEMDCVAGKSLKQSLLELADELEARP